MAPSVIQSMLAKYPSATKMKDKDGNLPLHCAFHSLNVHLVEVASLLLDADPSSALVPSKRLGSLLHFSYQNLKPFALIRKLCNERPQGSAVAR